MKAVKFKKLNPKAKLPTRAHDTDAGIDLYSIETVTIKPFEVAVVGTGLSIQLPTGKIKLEDLNADVVFEAQVRPRSGLAAKHGITVLNSPGTIDVGYTGEIKVILINLGDDFYTIKEGERIAQLVINAVVVAPVEETQDDIQTERGSHGIGSTGK